MVKMESDPGSVIPLVQHPPPPPPPSLSKDEVEALTRILEKRSPVKIWGLVLTCISILLYFVDTGLDIRVACKYYSSGALLYSWLTIGFVVGPAIIVTAFSIVLYILDRDKSEFDEPTCWQKVLMWVFSILPLGPVFRDANVIYYGLKSVNALSTADPDAALALQQKYYKQMLLEESDSAFLRLFERFLEAAPQVTLQIFIILNHICDSNPVFDSTEIRLSILLSFASLAWSLTVFNSTARTTNPEKQILTGWAKAFQFSWHFCMIVSRVCALAFFAVTHQFLIVPVCAIHWVMMVTWLTYLDSQYQRVSQTHSKKEDRSGCCSKFLEFVQRSCTIAVFAFVYIFAFFNTEEKPTRVKYMIFYALCFVENTIFVAISYSSSTQFEVVCVAGASYGLFFLGFAFMFAYYLCFHPSLRFSTMDGALRHLFDFKTTSGNVISQNGDS